MQRSGSQRAKMQSVDSPHSLFELLLGLTAVFLSRLSVCGGCASAPEISIALI